MKQLLLSLLLLCSNILLAQQSGVTNSLVGAKQYANPQSPSYNPAKALEIFSKAAATGNPKAMNGLGMLYQKGIGVPENYETALGWYEKAAAGGYAAGWYNAALMHKNGFGCKQDFKKAYEYYSKSAGLDHGSGIYGKGYMLYKGLGCEQDYRQAFALFKKSAPRGNTGSMYMLGLCYRNGYGTDINLDSARYWLQKVAARGDKRALAELAEPEAENSFEKKTLNNSPAAVKTAIRPEEKTLRKVQQHAPQGELEGIYTGYIIRYDWSGKHIIGQSELKLFLKGKDKLLSGQWEEDHTLSTAVQAELTDSALVFSNTTYAREDHYHKKEPLELEFREARLQLIRKGDSVYLAGNLRLYSTIDREPAKPAYISLVRKPAVIPVLLAAAPKVKIHDGIASPVTAENPLVDHIKVYPNPFFQSFRVNFTLKEAGKVWLYLSSMNGSLVYHEAVELQAGSHSREIAADILAGAYAFRIKYGVEVHSSVVIKQ